jgi:hypothetical protein
MALVRAGAAPTVAAVQKLTVVESTTLIPEAIDRFMFMRTMVASCNSHRRTEVGRFRLTPFPVARCFLQPAEIDIPNLAAQPSVIDELCPRHRIISLTGAEQVLKRSTA